MESFIKQVKSVLSCKVKVDKNDNIKEIHVLSDTNRSPKQISRDIQSGLISKFNYEVDYKKISIAQINEDSVNGDNERLIIKSIEFTAENTVANVKVTLESKEELYIGEISGVNTTYNSLRLIVTATLKAIETYLGVENNFILEDVKNTEIAGKEAVIASIAFVTTFEEQSFVGCAFVNRDRKEAIAKATLDAINRRIRKQ